MALSLLAGAAGTAAIAAYLNARFHIYHDLTAGGLNPNTPSAVRFLSNAIAKKRLLTYHILEDQALRMRPSHTFLIFEGREYTYAEFFGYVTRVGNWLLKDLRVAPGEVVAMNGGNSAEYLMLWFALDGIGAVPSFINCNLTGKSLMHCVKVGRVLLTLYYGGGGIGGNIGSVGRGCVVLDWGKGGIWC
ncbi:acetyl-CoA synthetase-like protein [Lepidopterella palustris CBS 459.81]|uniref:Acetyl-CoA synthetase-like protein n=1 Tax=Lepidopterella palustris CBS 459.81 TaxID=1314670 RepID=A0A8E2EAX4_9PEZI|nr:acetyl-CoA synthetase-like protein [Lepidopterella palustris CBS 459.81]